LAHNMPKECKLHSIMTKVQCWSHVSDLTGRNSATEISEISLVMLIQRSHYSIAIGAHMHSIDHFAVSKAIHDRVIIVFII
jgi:hypothetical protein